MIAGFPGAHRGRVLRPFSFYQ